MGRKTTCLLMSILYLIGGSTQLYADSILTFLAGRFLAGFALSIWTVAATLYNTEISTPESRGKIIGIQQLSAAFGMSLGYWLNFAIKSAKLEYEIALAGQLLFGVLSLMLFTILPESPRWYIMTHQMESATRAFAVMRNEDHDLEEELDDIIKDHHSMHSCTWNQVFAKRNWKKLKVCLLFVLFQQFAGQNLLFYYAPRLFKDLGLEENELLATGFLGLVKFLMTIPSLLVIDHLGRRPLMLIGTGIMLISFLYIGIYNTIEHSVSGFSGPKFGLSFFTWLAILSIYIFVGGYSISWGVIRYVLPAESFDQSTRAKANTLCQLIDWMFQMIGIKLSPFLMDFFKGQIYFLYSALLFCFLCWLRYLPETKSVLLEDMDSVYNPSPPFCHIDDVDDVDDADHMYDLDDKDDLDDTDDVLEDLESDDQQPLLTIHK